MPVSLYAPRRNRTAIALSVLRFGLNRWIVESMSIADFKNGEVNRGGRPRLPPGHVSPRSLHTTVDSLVGDTVLVRKGQAGVVFKYSDGRMCKHPDGERHDCAYVDARNLLIPRAEQLAFERYDKDKPMSHAREFMRSMTELAREKGLIK